jgi:hypothetical protein
VTDSGLGFRALPGGGAVDALVVEGGNGAYANVRGYGTLQPTSTGSDVTLHLTG